MSFRQGQDGNATAAHRTQALHDATRARGVELNSYFVDRPERIVAAIDEAHRVGAAALNVLASPMLNARRLDIFERTNALRLPAIYQWPESRDRMRWKPCFPSLYDPLKAKHWLRAR